MLSLLYSYFLFVSGVAAKNAFQFRDDDYAQYRTLPNHRIIKWNVTHYDRSAIAPGYWFTAPYWKHDGDRETGQWVPYQIGPHIFDQDGALVWAGSQECDNRPSFDFRVIDLARIGVSGIEIQKHLAWIMSYEPYAPETNASVMIFDNHYNEVRNITIPSDEFDGHDFNVIDNGSKALMIRISRDVQTLEDFGQPEISARIDNTGFMELDLLLSPRDTTPQRIVDWRARGRVGVDESYVTNKTFLHPDFMHANAIAKNQYGDYMLSARHTSTIYLISGRDGHIIWRLGGKKNNFDKDFNFFGQHDARFISVNETNYVISLMQNGAIDLDVQQPVSSAMYVNLDVVNMKATLLHQYMRPDGGSTERRGNMQTLPNTNVFNGWAARSYISEYSADGRLLMEAKFISERFDTYRSYKFPWIGRPLYPPTLLSESYGVNGSEISTAFHVSWNGATDIAYWRFFAQANSTSNRTEIGVVQKDGFETSFIARGFMDWVSVEALDSNMEVMGVSPNLRTPSPKYWTGETLPEADDPEAFLVIHTEAPAKQDISAMIGLFIAGLFSGVLIWTSFFYRNALKRYGLRCYSDLISKSAGYLQLSTTSAVNSPDLEERMTFLTDKAE
ncbi:hypothetical protein N7520_009893 [Penicillium odoratum]|uniref:uncharacterized protein n=1 Tax=Penicillium odoratum TaxID=1167516 RepID=UPI002548EAA3|nr:uncharacterized protein N7520_009893 [Penicillium odoratum]KAJ5752976.1 hypothetical protein N7520_009893 [Penicillium odoratum]